MEKSLKTLICCIAKMENHYIREWVEWYKNIGVTNICIFDNNDIDGECFEDVIGDYIDNGFVILKDVRGLKSNKNINLQTKSYQDCYNEYSKTYDWIGFFDADEYLEIENNEKITVFLANEKFKLAEAIRVCWKNYDDNNLITTPNDYSINRFKTLVNPDNICNRTSKVLIKCKQDNIKIYQKPGGEHGQFLNCKTMDCKGNFHDNISFILPERIWEGAWLRHYRFKTIDEYINLKLKRLYPNVNDNIAKKMLTIKDFFKYNKITKEKIEFYKKCMGINDIKTLICCIGKNENKYVREYVEWYKHIGVSHIRIYDNNDINGEHFEEVIGDYIKNGYVDIVNYRGRKLCQLQAYEECYKELGSEYDWVLFIDCGDEYLDFFKYNNINEYLSEPCFDSYDIIHINLMTFGDNEKVHYENKSLRERFPKPIPYDTCIAYNFPENCHISSIVRGKLPEVLWRMTPHTPYPCKLRCCNDVGELVNAESPFVGYSFRKAFFRHYTTKTAEEYCDKMKRGFPNCIVDNNRIKELIETRFFKTNKVTKEKVQVFKDKLGIDMSYLLPLEIKKRDDIKVYSLCYSNKNFDFLNDSVITPLQVGAVNETDVCELKDNIGDNISNKNYFYIENTGIYWIWKNVKDAKYKGQMQYRRPLVGVNENMDFDNIFSKYKVITCEPFNHPANSKPTKENPMFIPAMTVEQGYAFSNCIDDLRVIELVIDLYYPEYKESYKKYIKNGENLYYSNGFIMKSEDYNKYCEFLFGCLNKYEAMIDVSTPQRLRERVLYNMEVGKYPKHMNQQNITEEAIRWQMSIGGFLSERIWTLWLLHNFKEEEILKLPYNKMEEGMYT